MAGRFSVEAVFKAVDKVTAPISRMQNRVGKFVRGMDRGLKRLTERANRFKSVTGSILKAQVIGKGMGLLTSGIRSVTEGFIAFDKAALGATVRFKDIGPDAADFDTQLKAIRQSARDAGATTEFTAAQAADALDFLARAGFSSAEAMGSLGSMINLATASGEDFASVADMSSDLLGAFGLNANNTAEKIANLNRLNDVLVKSANSANVTIENMFETMKDAAPIGRTLGIELEEVAALTAIMGNAGIKGTSAGTALKNAFLNLSTAAPKVTKVLDAIGVKIDDGSGNMRKFTDILQDVGTATAGLGQLQTAQVMDALFGKRAIAGASNLITGIRDLKNFEQGLKSAGETSRKTAEIMRTSIDAKLKSLGSAATEAGFKILSAFEIDGKNGIDAFTQAIRDMDVQPLVDSLTTIFNIMSGVVDFTLKLGGGLGILAAKTVEFFEAIPDALRTNVGGFDAGFNPDDYSASAPPAPAVVSPQERIARNIEERKTTSATEVTIKDETGRAEVTGGTLGSGLKLQTSGAF